MCFVHIEQSDLSGSHTLPLSMIFQRNLISVMEPKSRPKSKDKDFEDGSTTPEKDAHSHDSMKSRSSHFNPANQVFVSTSSPAKFGRETCLESLPTTPFSSSSTASSQQSDFWDTPDQKGPKSNYPATSLIPPTPPTSPTPSTYGKQIFEPPSPTPRNRPGLLSIEKAQLSVHARKPLPNTTNRASATGCESHNDAFTEEATEAETTSNKPAFENSSSSLLKKTVKRRLFLQQRPGLQRQKAFEGLDVPDRIELTAVTRKTLRRGRSNSLPQERSSLREQGAYSKSSECLDVEHSIEPPLVTLKVKETGRSNPPQEGSGLQQKEAYTKSSECLDVEDSIESPSVTLKVKKSGRSNSLPPGGHRQQGSYSKFFERINAEANIKVPSVTPKVKQSGRSNPLRQEGSGLRRQRAHIKGFEGLGPQDGTESSSSDLKTGRSGCENFLQQMLIALQKPEAYTQEFQSQRPKPQSQERDLTVKKLSGPIKGSEARGQEPENTDYGIYFRAEVIKTEDRTRPKSTPSYIDVETLHGILGLRKARCVGSTQTKPHCEMPVAMSRWEVNVVRLEEAINIGAFLDCKGEIYQVAGKLLCRQHRDQASTVVEKWKTDFKIQIQQSDESESIHDGINSSSRKMSTENTDYGTFSRAEVIESDHRTGHKSTRLYIDEVTLQEILNLRKGKCAGLRPAKVPCKKAIEKSCWAKNSQMLTETVNKERFLNLEGEIHQIASELFCLHHKGQACEVVKTWRTDFEKWIGSDESGPVLGGLNSSSQEMSQGKNGLSTSSGPRTRSQNKGQTEELSRGKHERYTSSGPATSSQTHGQTREIAVLETFTRTFNPFSRFRQNLADHIWQVMNKKLTNQDTLAGLIYIYWIPGNQQMPEGLVKIGVTKVTAKWRFDQWTKCHPDLVRKYPSDPSDPTKFPHAHRVERLIHAELGSFQHRQIGCPCSKNHVELFAVPIETAIRVTKKWTEWARGLPYQNNGLIRTECIPSFVCN